MANLTSTSMLLVTVSMTALMGCTGVIGGFGEEEGETSQALNEGKKLFDEETFGGNGRTCVTCHSKTTGTQTLAQIAAIYDECQVDPNGKKCALFLQDGLDSDGVGTTRIREHGTIAVTLPLPPYITLLDDPGATTVTVNRGIPTTQNTPALDPVLMSDGRNSTVTFVGPPSWWSHVGHLDQQAGGAIGSHYEATVAPTQEELDAIAEFERTDNRFFSSHELAAFAAGGPAPELPLGETDAEKRGREFFVDAPLVPGSKKGICAACHSGPLLNRSNDFAFPFTNFIIPPGTRFAPSGVSDINKAGNPVRQWLINDGFGAPIVVSSPDIGVGARIPPIFPPLPPRAAVNSFKIMPLRGVSRTAPYFHDNSAKTLQEVVQHYVIFFQVNPLFASLGADLSGDVDDIAAYLALL